MTFAVSRATALALLLACAAPFAANAARQVADELDTADDLDTEDGEVDAIGASLLQDLEVAFRGITLELLEEKLPFDMTQKSKKIRKKLFRQADGNGNGILSLAEIDKMVRDELGVGDIGPSGISAVLIRAYQVARNYGKGKDMTQVVGMKAALMLKKANLKESTVDRREFRVLFEYIHKYFQIYQKFKAIDKDFDGRIDQGEFQLAQQNGIMPGGVTFSDIDVDNGGHILFDEFAAYAIAHGGLDDEEEE